MKVESWFHTVCIFSIALTFMALVYGCKNDKATTAETNLEQNNKEAAVVPKTETDIVDPSGYLSTSQIVNDFLSTAESLLCKSKDPIACLREHASYLRNDLLQNSPITLNVPYDKQVDWSTFQSIENFDQFLSGKCGFSNQKTGEVVNFYCPNINSVAGSWMDSLSHKQNLIKAFYDYYKRAQTFEPNFQRSFILESDNSLDVNNLDHRAFYWMYHLTLAEEMRASAAIKATTK